ncbi:C1 family peptidase [Nannocystis sp.]|uniref:C1 family peptidase n=1 Tax=Nannocystis sp. TaxID=1962667 RepID=UPI00242836C1|nr:C1 family peptidase [Nannocystis sp.]MBK7828943.1 TerB family tellurite resistance protein [Nannocystis sp.]MBK9757662.1 TerB family tellurite resistance protein [Nannocystis sp.]
MKLKRANGETLNVGGYHFVEAPKGTHQFVGSPEFVPPAKVDLRHALSAVEQQGKTESCAAHAAAGACEYLLRRHQADAGHDVSRLFIYYNARASASPDTSSITDKGASLPAVMKALKQHGACRETSWPFEEGSVNQAPPKNLYEEGKRLLIEGEESVPTTMAAWKAALANGHPILFAVQIFRSFASDRAGLIPMPTSADRSNAWGGHAMLCVGYSDADAVFIVRNSHGTEFGDAGYCYIPYTYMMSYNYHDSWIIKHVDALEPDKSTWSTEDDGVLDKADTILSKMSEKEYSEMLDAMDEHRFELRLALLFYHSAAADNTLSEAEISKVAEYLRPILKRAGGDDDANGILGYALAHIDNQALIDESIALFARFFSAEDLAWILSAMRRVNETDGELAQERAFHHSVAKAWRIEG